MDRSRKIQIGTGTYIEFSTRLRQAGYEIFSDYVMKKNRGEKIFHAIYLPTGRTILKICSMNPSKQ